MPASVSGLEDPTTGKLEESVCDGDEDDDIVRSQVSNGLGLPSLPDNVTVPAVSLRTAKQLEARNRKDRDMVKENDGGGKSPGRMDIGQYDQQSCAATPGGKSEGEDRAGGEDATEEEDMVDGASLAGGDICPVGSAGLHPPNQGELEDSSDDESVYDASGISFSHRLQVCMCLHVLVCICLCLPLYP